MGERAQATLSLTNGIGGVDCGRLPSWGTLRSRQGLGEGSSPAQLRTFCGGEMGSEGPRVAELGREGIQALRGGLRQMEKPPHPGLGDPGSSDSPFPTRTFTGRLQMLVSPASAARTTKQPFVHSRTHSVRSIRLCVQRREVKIHGLCLCGTCCPLSGSQTPTLARPPCSDGTVPATGSAPFVCPERCWPAGTHGFLWPQKPARRHHSPVLQRWKLRLQEATH